MEVIKAGDGRTGIELFDDPGEIVTALLHSAGFVRLRLGEFLERYELTEGRHSVLAALDQAGARGLSQSEVAEQLMQSESNVSSLIDRLHRDGLVDRRWSVTDRRKRVLLLTADGQQLIQQVEGARHRWAEALLSDLAPLDRQALSQSLKRLPGGSRGTVTQRTTTVIPVIEAVRAEVLWPVHSAVSDRDPKSPHFALEQMLSTLGVAGRGNDQ